MKPRKDVPAGLPHLAPLPPSTFRRWRWRAGNASAGVFARAGIGPIAMLTTTGRRTGRRHTVPVVPVDHAGTRWLVAPYGPVEWLHNARVGAVVLRHGRQASAYSVRDATAAEAGPVLRRYATVAAKTRDRFPALDAPDADFIAAATDHPVVELVPLVGNGPT